MEYLYLFLLVNGLFLVLLVDGLSIIHDYRTSRKAADQGDAEAQMALSDMYYLKNINESLKWMRKAADQGYSYAQGCLGLAYANGMGNLDEDYDEAVKWYRKAFDQGYSYAQCRSFAQDSLWWSHVDGMGVFKDGKKAVKWCLKAADRGEHDAKDLLVSIYNFGLAGVYKNDKEAVKWMSEVIEETNRETKSEYW